MKNIWIKSIGTLALATGLAACEYIHDDSLAPCEYRLRFVYDYNMKFADAFQHEVTRAALFICDDKGTFIERRDLEGTELKANNVVMDLEPGTYTLLTWAGLDDGSYTWPDLTPGTSTVEDIKVRTLREADGTQPRELEPLLRKAVWRKPQFPVYCNLHGRAVTDGESAKESLLKQMTSSVLWIETVRNQYADGVRRWVEVGPKAVLGKMVPACLNHLDEAARQELRVELVNSLESVENFSA